MYNNARDAVAGVAVGTGITWVVLALICGALWGCPKWNVYRARLAGEAELAQATANRQIKIQEAHAAKESAVSLAEAEVLRAGGVAKANAIIGQSLHNNEAYLRYLWIHQLVETKNQIIYVPTEASLPILEASRQKSSEVDAGNKPAQ